jgi:spermidine synthase
MARPWETVDFADTPEGRLELRRRGPRELLITIAGRVLMNSEASRSESALGRLACEPLAKRAAPRVLVGGLGMACTLRACLDALPPRARVLVCELNDAVVRWCTRGPLADLTDRAAADPRVAIRAGDVADAIRDAAQPGADRYDALVLDLYEGPQPGGSRAHPHYGETALANARAALAPGGVFALWSEGPDARFARHLERAGFAVRVERPGRGGRRHAVYVATRR